MTTASSSYDALALFSGGLDSVLAAKTVQAQGLRVLGLHFVSPFFGKPDKLARWQRIYGLDVTAVDVGDAFAAMMAAGPAHGYGKHLNPCIACKILMLSRARELLPEYGARFIISGEVLGQRPMSQRRDALDVISRDSGTRDLLLRPLSARFMKPTPMEESGLVDRERLHNISGRGRTDQLKLAAALGVTEIPTPAGGCRLAEKESARRYFDVLKYASAPRAVDFELSNTGRQLWAGPLWLAMARNRADNERLEALARPGDLLLKPRYPGPVALCRALPGSDARWTPEAVADAAALTAGFAPKARAMGGAVRLLVVEILDDSGRESVSEIEVTPSRESLLGLAEPAPWDERKADKPEMLAARQGFQTPAEDDLSDEIAAPLAAAGER